MWLFEILLGMFLAYLILSPRLRKWVFRRNRTQSIEHRVEAEEKREKRDFVHQATPAMPLNKHDKVFIKDETEVNDWLKNNPDLRKINNMR